MSNPAITVANDFMAFLSTDRREAHDAVNAFEDEDFPVTMTRSGEDERTAADKGEAHRLVEELWAG